MKRLVALLVPSLFALLPACSGSSSSSAGTINGSVSGNSVKVQDSFAIAGSRTNNGVQTGYVMAVLSDFGGSCGLAQSNHTKPNTHALGLMITKSGGGVGTGTYQLGGNVANGAVTMAIATFEGVDGSCNKTLNEDQAIAKSGSITISAISGGAVSGSFDVTFANGDHLTGNFDAPTCNANLMSDDQKAPLPPPVCEK